MPYRIRAHPPCTLHYPRGQPVHAYASVPYMHACPRGRPAYPYPRGSPPIRLTCLTCLTCLTYGTGNLYPRGSPPLCLLRTRTGWDPRGSPPYRNTGEVRAQGVVRPCALPDAAGSDSAGWYALLEGGFTGYAYLCSVYAEKRMKAYYVFLENRRFYAVFCIFMQKYRGKYAGKRYETGVKGTEIVHPTAG